jgi:propanol-preferring alcohol dehydrogenase
MSDIPSFSYDLLWGERSILSVANLTRQDGREFFQLAPQVPIHTQVKVYALEDANQALDDLRHGRFEGSAVIKLED